MTEEAFLLTPGERNSPVWQKILEHLRRRLEALRIENDRAASEVQTAALRGRIAAYKALIGLDAEPPNLD